MNRDAKELREMGLTDAEIAKILADGDEKVAEEIAEELKSEESEEDEDEDEEGC